MSLQLSFPPQYPSDSPPEVSLSAFWLTPAQLCQLQGKLHELWEEQEGEPICFAWADWLAHSALEHLGIFTTLTLEPTDWSELEVAAADAASAPQHAASSTSLSDNRAPQADSPSSSSHSSLDAMQSFQHFSSRHPANGQASADGTAPPGLSNVLSARKQHHHPRRRRRRSAAFTAESGDSNGTVQQGQHNGNASFPSCSSQMESSSLSAADDQQPGTPTASNAARLQSGGQAEGSNASHAAAPRQLGSSATSSQTAEAVLLQMMQYNASKQAALFCQQQWTCKICLEEVTPGTPNKQGVVGKADQQPCNCSSKTSLAASILLMSG